MGEGNFGKYPKISFTTSLSLTHLTRNKTINIEARPQERVLGKYINESESAAENVLQITWTCFLFPCLCRCNLFKQRYYEIPAVFPPIFEKFLEELKIFI